MKETKAYWYTMIMNGYSWQGAKDVMRYGLCEYSRRDPMSTREIMMFLTEEI